LITWRKAPAVRDIDNKQAPYVFLAPEIPFKNPFRSANKTVKGELIYEFSPKCYRDFAKNQLNTEGDTYIQYHFS
jgi:hypothetical protein